jgi:fatty acid amide hydrolase 2
LNAFELWSARAQSIENRHFQNILTNGQSLQFGKEFLNLVLGRRNYTATSLITAFLEKNFSPKVKNQTRLLQQLKQLIQLQKEISQMLGKNSVILMPVHPKTAPRLGETIKTPFDFSYTAIINALNLPSTSVPTGVSITGLPLGIQIVANTDQDHLSLRVGEHLELAFGGRPKPNI